MNKAQNKPENLPSWNVTFQQNDSVVRVFSDLVTLETAVKYALTLHEASNSKHSIYVMHDDIIDIVFHKN